jgi:hypothetical protein
MGLLNDIGNAFSDGAEALGEGAEAIVDAADEAISDGEEAIDEGMKDFGQWFIDELLGSGEDFMTDGGSEVDTDPIEERAEQGSISSKLDAAQIIPFDPAREYGLDSDELTLPPSRFTSRFSDADDSDRQLDGAHFATDGAIGTVADIQAELDPHGSDGRDTITGGMGFDTAIGSRGAADQHLDGVHLASDGAIGTIEDTTTQTHFSTGRSPDRSEYHDGESELQRSPDRAENHEPSGGAASETRDDSGETLLEARNDGNAMQFVVATDNGGGETLADAVSDREGAARHAPEWTNFNHSDPSITLADGGWMNDADLRPRDDDRSLRREGGSFSVETETQHMSFATTLEDASPTLSWLS